MYHKHSDYILEEGEDTQGVRRMVFIPIFKLLQTVHVLVFLILYIIFTKNKKINYLYRFIHAYVYMIYFIIKISQ